MADKGGKSKLDEAAGGMDLDAEEDRKLLEMFHTMKRKPGIKTAEDFTHLIMQMEQMRVKEETEDVDVPVQRSRDCIVETHTDKATSQQKKGYDTRAKAASIEIGDKVLVRILAYEGKNKHC